MDGQLKIQNLLRSKFFELKAKNSRFSMRAFSKKINMLPSATNEIMRGERRVSRKIAEKIANNLMLNPMEKSELLFAFPEKLKSQRNKRNLKIDSNYKEEKDYLKLTSEQFYMIADGIHFAVLSLIQTKDFQSDIDWCAKRLNSTPKKIKAAINRLEKLQLIKIKSDGLIERTSKPLMTNDDVFDLSIQKSHLMDLEVAKEKLVQVDVKDRDFTSVTLPADPLLLPKAKEILRETQNKLEMLMSEGDSSEVYKLGMYFYPLTNIKNKKGEDHEDIIS